MSQNPPPSSPPSESPMSRTHQYRKVMKPLLERRRRARINKYLDELKDLMIQAIKSQGESIAKLEKADVLELTVKHLKDPPNGTSMSQYKAGYIHCTKEISRYAQVALDPQTAATLLSHLGYRIRSLEREEQSSAPSEPQKTWRPW